MRQVVLTAVLTVLLAAGPSFADKGGVDFRAMPVGCIVHNRYSNGNEWVEVYVGRKGADHITRTYQGPARAGKLDRLVSTVTYTAEGFMRKRVWASGKWETFEPFSCFSRPGRCTYLYRNADGARKRFVGQVRPTKEGYVSSGGFEGEPPFAPTTVTTGQFGLTMAYREGDTRYRVVKLENCAPVS